MSKKMNTVRDMGSDISDSESDSDDEMVESDPVVLADFEDIRRKLQGPIKKHDLQLYKSLSDVANSTKPIRNSKAKLKKSFQAKLKGCEQKLREMELSRDYWKKDAEEKKILEKGLRDEKEQQASTIKNLRKELEKCKQECRQIKINSDCKLKESESRYETLIKSSEDEVKKWKLSNKQLLDNLSALDRTKRDLELKTEAQHLKITILETDMKRVTVEKGQLTVERNEALQREKQLIAEVASRESTIELLVIEELERRMAYPTAIQIISQNLDQYKDILKKKNISDTILACLIQEANSVPCNQSPLSTTTKDGTESGGKKRKVASINSDHVSEEEGEIINQQPQQEATSLATQSVTVPIPVVPVVGARPQTLFRCNDNGNGTSVNANTSQFQINSNPTTALNAYRDNNRRNADWNKQSGGRGRKN